MRLQISSGQGPVECELAVAKFADALCNSKKNAAIYFNMRRIEYGQKQND